MVGDSVGTREETADAYSDYYASKPTKRNDLLGNPEVLFQALAGRRAWIEALRGVSTDANVLNVGGGGGTELALLLDLGFSPELLRMVDILPERTQVAQKRFPGMDIRCCDAQELPWPADTFDVVAEGTMFLQITDERVAQRVASEMWRVSRPGALLLLADWRYDGWREGFRAVDRQRVRQLFGIPQGRCTLERVVKSALVPPLGRRLSAHMPSLYFLVQRFLPWAVGHVVYVLRKNA